MNTPVRTLIRQAFFNAIATLVPAGIVGAVKLQRWHQVTEADLDAAGGVIVCIQAGDQELNESAGSRPRDQFIRYALDAVVVAKNTGDVDAVIDLVDAHCRAAVAADPTAGDNAKDLEYQGIHDYGEDQENLDIVAAPIRWVASYVTPENAPDTPL